MRYLVSNCERYLNHAVYRLGFELDRIIKNNIIVVGGSFVISAILNERYDNSDIDLYAGYNYTIREDGSIDSILDNYIVNSLGGVLSQIFKSEYVFNYKYFCPNMIININHTKFVSKGKIVNHIKKVSDLDICCSTYDGYFFQFPDNLLIKKANVINLHLREDTFRSDQYDPYLRIQEYNRHDRIFSLKRNTRIYKYMERGFIIYHGIYPVRFRYFQRFNFQTHLNLVIQKNEELIVKIKWLAKLIIEYRNSKKTLFEVLKGREMFKYDDSSFNVDLHKELVFENFPWVAAWLYSISN